MKPQEKRRKKKRLKIKELSERSGQHKLVDSRNSHMTPEKVGFKVIDIEKNKEGHYLTKAQFMKKI